MVRIKWIDGTETKIQYVIKADPISPELIALKDINDKIRYYVSVKEMRYVAND